MSAAGKLMDYLNYKSSDSNELLSLIKKLHVNLILHSYLEDLNKEEYLRTSVLLAKQREKNKLIEHELSQILYESKNSGIKLLHLKGLFLAADLYKPIESRIHSDIDLLVHMNDADTMLAILDRLGYITSKGNKRPIDTDVLYSIPDLNDFTHLEAMFKRSRLNGQEYCTELDLHLNPLYQMPIFDLADNRNVFNRAVLENVSSHTVWLLDVKDRLIHLMAHFSRHYLLDFRRYFQKCNQLSPQIRLLHDIALFIEKYGRAIDWDSFLHRVKELHQCEHIALSVHLFDRIYPGMIPEYYIEKMKQLVFDETVTNDEARSRLATFLVAVAPDDIILGIPYELAKKAVKALREDKPKIQCSTNQTYNDGVLRFIPVDETPQHYSKYIQYYKKSSLPSEYSATGDIWWNDDFFNIFIKLNDKVFNARGNQILPSKFGRFVMTFDVHNENNISFASIFFVFPKIVDNQPSVEILKDTIALDKSKYRSSLKIFDDGYEIELNLPWHFLSLNPYKGLEFGFDITFQRSEGTHGSKHRLELFNHTNNGQFATEYGNVILR